MYKTFALILLLTIGLSNAARSFNKPEKNVKRVTSNPQEGNVNIDFCPLCINEAVEAINVILNVILDEGIIQGCGDLCQAVGNKTSSKFMEDVCLAACDGFGIDEFIRLIITVDLDPIWYCETADMCPINDHGDAKYTNFGVYPKTGPQGTKFLIDCSFKTLNGTGTSMLRIDITDSHNETNENDFLVEAKKPGAYTETIALDTFFAWNCDSTTGLCDDFPIGTYNVTAQLCNGECGSHHPHSSIYDVGFGSFTVTKRNKTMEY